MFTPHSLQQAADPQWDEYNGVQAVQSNVDTLLSVTPNRATLGRVQWRARREQQF